MEPFVLIIFGITGSLAKLKLIPALFSLEEKGLLPKDSKILGIARRQYNKTEFENYISDILKNRNNGKQKTNSDVLKRLLRKFNYVKGDLEKPDGLYSELKKHLDKKSLKNHNHLFYLATYPLLYSTIFKSLKKHNLTNKNNGWVRLMIEKPIGTDYKSAKELTKLLKEYFSEEQIFRIDHYLGKETIQNILVFRFGNGIVQPIMNRENVDHIQITFSEDFGVGQRAGYFDGVGTFKDVGQNHLLQMLVVATMDPPLHFTNKEVTDERIKILKKLIPFPKDVVFGQYNGYLYEEKVNSASTADTYFALKTEVDSEKWRGVPIYIRAGKKLAKTVAEISVIFKTPVSKLFHHHELGERPNILTYRLQPNEGIGMEILTKKPGHKFQLDSDYMQFCYRESPNNSFEAYEKLIYDAMMGDPTFFNDSVEVEASWKFVDSYMKEKKKLYLYDPGSWGPKEADALIEKDGRKWIEPSELLCRL